MTINSLVGILHQSGVPFLNRQFGGKTLPFSLIGSLGGLFTFTNSCENTELLGFSHNDLRVKYRIFNGVILLVYVTTDNLVTPAYINHALEQIHLFIVAEYGLNNLSACQNADKLKSSISTSLNPLTSLLFEEFNCPSLSLMAYQVTFLNRDIKLWSSKLEKYLDIVGTAYGCVFHKSKLHVVSSEWQKLPFMECHNLLLMCSKFTLPPEKLLKKKLVYLPCSSQNSQFLLVCCNYHTFRVFGLCPPNLEDSDVLSAFNRVFTSKDTSALVKDEINDTIRFDAAILGLMVVKDTESIVYISDGTESVDTSYIKKILSYSTTRDLLAEDIVDENGFIRETNAFFFVNKSINCHVISNDKILVAGLFKSSISQILSSALLDDVVAYFQDKKKK